MDCLLLHDALTLEKALALLERTKHDWLQTECRRQVAEDLARHRPTEGWEISDAFCVGVGPLADARVWNAGHAYVRKCMAQLVCFLDIVDICAQKSGSGSIQMYVQELEVGHIEQAIFDRLGIKAIRAPEAERRIKSGSFAFLPNVLMDSEILARCCPFRPTMLLGRSVGQMRENAGYFSTVARE
ncbi:hypothetical protein LTR36_008070 [Oleoguttula mirabilis]|uniref:SRR1-like domain-containing protein n=1 Tax=Oleoguttula mirabilis TaxID=1507867 RepID=A0AAV9J9B8_9PEZI|nr:hypothetical protein LTR36_008070 [Oleoguttula mirabilis]